MNAARALRVPQRGQRGMALVEALIAVLILAVGLIGALGMQLRSQTALSEASMRSEATIAANELIGLINTDLDNLDSYVKTAEAAPGDKLADWYGNAIARLPGGRASVEIAPAVNSETTGVIIDIRWQRNADSQVNNHRIVTYVARRTTWAP